MKRLYFIAEIVVALCLVLLGLSGCGVDDSRKEILKVYNWADYIDEELLSEFEEWYFEQTGEKVEVVYQLFDINEIMLAKIERGKEDFDVVCPSEYIIERMLRNDLLLPINKDFGSTPNYLGNVSPYIHEVFNKIDGSGKDANDYAVGYMWGTTGFLYNPKYVTREEVSSWSALWNPKFSKKLLIKDAFRDVYCPLLIYAKQEELTSGEVTLDSLMYDSSDESIALVEGLLKKAKPYVAGWEADFGKEIMTKEKAWLNLSWSGDAVWAIDEAEAVGVELDYVVPEEGSIVWFDGWVIPKYAKNPKAASYFINFMCKSENAIRNMEEIGYVSVIGTPEVMEYMSESAVESGFEEPLDVEYFFGEGADSVVLNPALYPDKSVIDRCAMMHDSGPRTANLLEMWSRVKGDNLNNGMVIFILVVFGVLLVVGIARKVRRRRQRQRRW
ncbi:MAG: ABC transporter substrate-binding protein [Rikenellaceae bacterium]|nr:ABC transporter substrate-binding protein [Rikenellaceae bacterium]